MTKKPLFKISSSKIASSAAAWSSFGVMTTTIILIFWVLFPFYSYQLQIIFDQDGCFEEKKFSNLNNGTCNLPSKINALPYCPDSNSKESIDGPDIFTKFFNLFKNFMKQIYTIITGIVWIEADKVIDKVMDDSNFAKSKEIKTGGGNNNTPSSEKNTEDLVIKKAISILKSTPGLHVNNSNYKNMAFCEINGEEMKNYYKKDIKKYVEKKNENDMFKRFPFSYITPTEFGWPYTYLYNKDDSKPTRYSKNNDKGSNSIFRLIGAWFAKTQQLSWSTMRNFWSIFLGLFLPFLKEEVTKEDIQNKLEIFKKQLTKFHNANKNSKDISDKINEIKDNFISIIEEFEKQKAPPRIALFNVMKKYMSKQLYNTQIDEKTNQETNEENIYLRFFVSALRTAKYDGSRWFKNSLGLGGDLHYWMRYIITWFIPILCMVLMGITIFLGFWITALNSINRYSAIILPFFFGFVTSLYNMFVLPVSLFGYLIMGGLGKKNKSKSCPYDSGIYQMKRNFWQYLPLNIYLTLGIISMQLGKTLISTGKHTEGIILNSAFPVLFLIAVLYRILSALFNFV